jgi:hypothetical protein
MARFAKFPRRDGGYAFINIERITSFEISATNDDATIVRFDKDNTVTVLQRLDDVFRAISEATPA